MSAASAIRVMIADDQLLFAEALATALAMNAGIEVVGIAANGVEAVELSAVLRPDVILMDLRMPVMDGIEATRRIVSAGPAAPRILILTGADEPGELQAAREAGASGYLTKAQSTAALTDALTGLVSIAAALHGEPAEPER
jgi:DNA-binding NarL/FixJ family response regulator